MCVRFVLDLVQQIIRDGFVVENARIDTRLQSTNIVYLICLQSTQRKQQQSDRVDIQCWYRVQDHAFIIPRLCGKNNVLSFQKTSDSLQLILFWCIAMYVFQSHWQIVIDRVWHVLGRPRSSSIVAARRRPPPYKMFKTTRTRHTSISRSDISGWQRITMMKVFDSEVQSASPSQPASTNLLANDPFGVRSNSNRRFWYSRVFFEYFLSLVSSKHSILASSEVVAFFSYLLFFLQLSTFTKTDKILVRHSVLILASVFQVFLVARL
jgi:hypothetical protein